MSVFVTGLCDDRWREELPHSLRQVLEAQGAQAPAIRVVPVETLQRGATGKAPLIVSRLREPVRP